MGTNGVSSWAPGWLLLALMRRSMRGIRLMPAGGGAERSGAGRLRSVRRRGCAGECQWD